MRVEDLGRIERDGWVERSARVRWNGGEVRLGFEGPAAMMGRVDDASPFLAATLLPAMVLGEDLEIDGPVSADLEHGTRLAARYYHLWCADWRVPDVVVAGHTEPPARAPAVGCFFSRGVDSMYSAAVPRREGSAPTVLVHCETLEPLHDERVRAEEVRVSSEAADALGLRLEVVRTDLRDFTNPLVGWADMHGAGLAAIALACGGGVGRMLVPGFADISTLGAAGSHPLLDPLFGTEWVQVDHDTLEAGRHQKVAWLAEHRPDLLAHLKVCWMENRPDNCGRCRKCLWTMVCLQAAGALDRATGFPDRIDLDALRAVRISELNLRMYWMQAAQALGRHGTDGEVRAAVMHVLRCSAQPPLRELVAIRRAARAGAPSPFDPEQSSSFERCFREETNRAIALVRRGEPWPPEPGTAPRLAPMTRAIDAALWAESRLSRSFRARRRA